jgi:hypothetical protein
MDELYRIAARYHRDLYSLQAFGGLREPFVLLFLLGLAAMTVSLGWFVVVGTGRDGGGLLGILPLALLAVSAVVLSVALRTMTARRDGRIRSRLSAHQGRCDDARVPVQVCLLEQAFRCDRGRFLDLARSIRDAIEMEEAYNRRRSIAGAVASFLSFPQSGSTLLALFAILATVITLASNPELTLSDLIGILADAGHVIFPVAAVVVVVTAVLVLIVRYQARELSDAWSFLSMAHLPEDAKSLPAVRNLVRDLNRFHTWEVVARAEPPAWKARVKRGLRRRSSAPRDAGR